MPSKPKNLDEAIPEAPPAKPKASPKSTVTQHRDANYPPIDGLGKKRPHPGLAQHAAAAALHCWAQCKHHENAEMELTAEVYAAAIKAGGKLDSKGIPHPHLPALYVVKGS